MMTASLRHYYYLLITLLLLLLLFVSAEEAHESDGEEAGLNDVHEGEEETEQAKSLLFPSFSVTIGVIVFFLLSRYLHALPYTAVMFLIGTAMGIGVALTDNDNHLHESVQLYVNIDSEVLLLVFLPGLIFKDAYGQNVHLFAIALGQCLIFAFPLVLAGTSLTALMAYHVFPYGWSFNLCMTFGVILSATDPVAVAALLEQVGAPPRLKVHIAGEALLNDGAAIVFFEIFFERFLYDIGLLDHNIGWKDGFAMFFQKSLGAVASGLFFGLGLLTILYYMGRRFNREENVVEVSATIGVAYLGYYVAEVVWGTSGVLATVALGVTVKFLGRPMINDAKLLEDFWSLVEHLLNTVLFTLGGAVWGAVIAKGEEEGTFTGREFGFLVLLYIFLAVIRLLLFAIVYPITSRIGLKTNLSETLFQVYGGLRGAVGIALALSLDSVVRTGVTEDSNKDDARRLFGFVGGIAFMTLVINGTTAGPLLKKMRLADSTETRKKLVSAFHTRFVASAIDDMVRLLTQPRFKNINFALVKHHVPYLKDLTRAQLMEAVEKHKDTSRPEEYSPPELKNILPYLEKEDEQACEVLATMRSTILNAEEDTMEFDPKRHARKMKQVLRTKYRMKRRTFSSMRVMMGGGDGDPLTLQELRGLFISLLRAAYETQINQGELEAREFMAVALDASLDFAADAVQRGEPLKDWEYVRIIDSPITMIGKGMKTKAGLSRIIETVLGQTSRDDAKISVQRLNIERSLAFMAAHRHAQQYMQNEFEDADHELSELGKTVFSESQEQYRKAEAVLSQYPNKQVGRVVSHKFCLILLNCGVSYVARLLELGLLKEQEAEHMVEELEEDIKHVLSCNEEHPPGKFPQEDDSEDGRIIETECES